MTPLNILPNIPNSNLEISDTMTLFSFCRMSVWTRSSYWKVLRCTEGVQCHLSRQISCCSSPASWDVSNKGRNTCFQWLTWSDPTLHQRKPPLLPYFQISDKANWKISATGQCFQAQSNRCWLLVLQTFSLCCQVRAAHKWSMALSEYSFLLTVNTFVHFQNTFYNI